MQPPSPDAQIAFLTQRHYLEFHRENVLLRSRFLEASLGASRACATL